MSTDYHVPSHVGVRILAATKLKMESNQAKSSTRLQNKLGHDLLVVRRNDPMEGLQLMDFIPRSLYNF